MGTRHAQVGGLSLTVVILSATVVRLALFLVSGLDFVPRILERRPELGTPVNSFKVIKEALFLQKLYKSSKGALPKPYASGTLHLPPIILGLLEPFLGRAGENEATLNVYTAVVWTGVDVMSALLLAHIFARKQKYLRQIHVTADQAQLDVSILAGSMFASPGGVAAAHLFNPLTLASCLARTSSAFNSLAILAAIDAALAASPLFLALSLACATLISLYPILLLPALSLLCAKMAFSPPPTARRTRGSTQMLRTTSISSGLMVFILTAAAVGAGLYASYLVAGEDWLFLERAYGTILLVPDLSPNIGLWWYFFIEIFDHFRDFFLLTFNVHAAVYALPLTIKYTSDPLFAITALTGFTALLKSYPTMGDTALFLSLLSLHREITPYLRHPLLTALLYALSTLMMPALHHLWLEAGSGNANFFYATTLIWAFASGAAVIDAMWAWGRWRWEAERPQLRLSVEVTKGKTFTRRVVQS